MKTPIRTLLLVGAILTVSTPAWAHVVVGPKTAGLADWVTFTIAVPNEKEVPNTTLKLAIPEGLHYVTPTVKPGWKTSVEKDTKGNVTAIVWEGNLPPEFRDDFTFSAQVPDKAGDLNWKAYQTYQDGTVVGWDVDPASPEAKDAEALEKTGRGPYSVTKVIDDLSAPATSASGDSLGIIALVAALTALGLSIIALRRRL